MIRTSSLLAFSALVSLMGACSPGNQSEALEATSSVSLDLKVIGLKTSSEEAPSQLCYAVFNGPEGFLTNSEKAVKQGCLPVSAETLEFTIENIPSRGKGFVVSVFQDLNMSEKMETKKFFGFDVPAEPFGFTNNPSLMGAPTFDKCKINAMYGVTYEIKLKTM